MPYNREWVQSWPSHFINARQTPKDRRDKYAFVRAYSGMPKAKARRARDWTWRHIYQLCNIKPA